MFAVILGALVHREGLRVFSNGDWSFILRVLAGAAIMGAAVFAWSLAFERGVDVGAEPARLFEFVGGLTLGALVYSVALQLQGIRAIPDALGRLSRMVIEWRRG